MTDKSADKYIHLIINAPHGLVSGKSASTNLVLYGHYISSALSKYRQVVSIYLDFQNAFDTIYHGIQLYKRLIIRGSRLTFIKIYAYIFFESSFWI